MNVATIRPILVLLIGLLLSTSLSGQESDSAKESSSDQKLKALIVDGQNNHGAWPENDNDDERLPGIDRDV